jgi:hypothetical protein
VGQDVAEVNGGVLIADARDHPVLVAAHVEHDAVADRVDRVERRLDIGELRPDGLFDDFAPLKERGQVPGRFGVTRHKLAELPPRDQMVPLRRPGTAVALGLVSLRHGGTPFVPRVPSRRR